MQIFLLFTFLFFGFREVFCLSLFNCPQLPVLTSVFKEDDPASLKFPCGCNTSTVWNDVIFIFDNSEGTGTEHLNDLVATFQTLVSVYNIANTLVKEPMAMRGGIVTYATNATVVVPLGELTSASAEQLQLKVCRNDYKTNIKEAIHVATTELHGPYHRISSTQVIVIFSTTFNPSGEDSPCSIAKEFKQNGGIIITYDYLTNEREDGSLYELASPGYAFNSSMDTPEEFDQFQKAQCSANCKCMNNYKPYGLHSQPAYPLGGCYWPVSAPANELLAEHRCTLPPAEGTLVTIESEEKTTFLNALFTSPRNYFIGATYDSSSTTWFWPDGSSIEYNNWCGGNIPTNSSTQCALVKQASNFCWQATECRNAYSYICEAPPCDSTHYCGEE